MSLAFEIEAAPHPGLRAMHVASVALAGAGFGLAAWLAPQPWGLALVGSGVPACWLAWRHGGRGLSWGRLAVDELGQARWHGAGAAAAADPQRVRIERWCATERLVWIGFRAAGERRRRDALFVRGGCDAARWRSLRRWLIWLGRGPA